MGRVIIESSICREEKGKLLIIVELKSLIGLDIFCKNIGNIQIFIRQQSSFCKAAPVLSPFYFSSICSLPVEIIVFTCSSAREYSMDFPSRLDATSFEVFRIFS